MRRVLVGAVAALSAAGLCAVVASAGADPPTADVVVLNARVTTMDEARPEATAFAVKDGRFLAVGDDTEIAACVGEGTRTVDALGHRVVPGLNDSHAHAVRAGRFYHLELRWDGVETLERGLAMIREQAGRTPPGHWVRVVGGWTPYQFAERRVPTVAELNEAAPDTPTFVMLLYSQGYLNRAAVEALGLTADTPAPDGGRYEIVDGGAILHAEPNPAILYETIARLPQLSAADQVGSTLHFYRELNRLGVTSVVDAGGGGHAFPDDYAATAAVVREDELSLRVSYYLFPQTAGREADDFRRWTQDHVAGENTAELEHGYVLEGAGEFLAHSAGDWENFLAPRPDLDERAASGIDWAGDLREVVEILVDHGWPLRQHATYGESVSHLLDVFEEVAQERGGFVPRWAIDHAETVRDEDLVRIAAMGGGVAIQGRLAYAGEFFVERYGAEAASRAPPVGEMLALGIPVGAGTDGTRVGSYNPWPTIEWLVTGKTLGGTQLLSDENRLSPEEALRLFTVGSAWFSQEEAVKGRIAPGQYADFAVLSRDCLAIPEADLGDLESVLTVVAGEVVHAAGAFEALAPPPLPPVRPEWSPVARFGGHQ